MKDYHQPQDDLLLVEQEIRSSLKEYLVVIQDVKTPAPIKYLKVQATSVQDATREVNKIIKDDVKILRMYPEK